MCKKILSALLCIALLFGCVSMTGCDAKKQALDGATIITFGDSLTAFGTWPLSVAEEANMYLFNAATGGINTKEALERFDRYVANREPDFVTLCFGMNDMLTPYKNLPQVNPDDFKENMNTMCEKILEMGATPLLMTCSFLDESKFYSSQAQQPTNYEGNGGPLAWLDQYNDKVRELAEEKGYHMIDIREACNDYTPAEFLAQDGIHLGSVGNDVYTETIVTYLKENFKSNPNAKQITTRFPYVASPDEPAVTDIISYDPADWDAANPDELDLKQDDDGALLIANTNGQWPAAEYTAKESVLVPMEGSELVYDLSTANVNTSILLFFGGATPFAPTEGKYVVINAKLGVLTDPGSGDVKAYQKITGSVKLSDLGIPKTALDENGNVLFSGVKIFAAGTLGQPVTVRQLAVSTTGAPVE